MVKKNQPVVKDKLILRWCLLMLMETFFILLLEKYQILPQVAR